MMVPLINLWLILFEINFLLEKLTFLHELQEHFFKCLICLSFTFILILMMLTKDQT